MLKRIASLLLCGIMLLTFFVGCGKKDDEELIEDTIKDFLKAYNAGDLDAAIETFAYKERTALKSYIKIAESFGLGLGGLSFGLDASAIFGISVNSTSDEDIFQVKIIEIDVDEDEESATVQVKAKFDTEYAEEYYEGTFSMVKEDDDWYIKDMDLDKADDIETSTKK